MLVIYHYWSGLVIDAGLADIPATQLAEEIQTGTSPQTPPMILCGTHKPGAELESDIKRLSRSSVVRFAETNERLLEETALLLHRPLSALSEEQQRILAEVRQTDPRLAGRKVLVVDDGFLHRAVHIYASHVEDPSPRAVGHYVDLLSEPSLVVSVRCDEEICEARLWLGRAFSKAGKTEEKTVHPAQANVPRIEPGTPSATAPPGPNQTAAPGNRADQV
jgi:hypothetical protein